jgi:hypothetical protein
MTDQPRQWVPAGSVNRHVLNEKHRVILARWLPQLERNAGLAPSGFLDDLAEVVEAYAQVAARETASPSPGLEPPP